MAGPEDAMSTDRVEALTDGVYAIAMTILVLNLEIPPIEARPNHLIDALTGLWPDFTHYVLSFLLLGIFWTIHHRQFHWIERTDFRLLWINLFTLMFVALIPFTTSVSSDFRTIWPGPVMFDLNILMVGLLKLYNWTYVCQAGLVGDGLSSEDRISGTHRSLVTPGVACLAIAVAFVAPEWSTAAFILVPIIIPRVR